jgi:branched-chain amino acid transport system permease protein
MLGRVERGSAVRGAVIAGLLAFVLLGLPPIISSFYLSVATAVAIYCVVSLGVGVLYGRVGMVSLCQVALLGMGGWIALRLSFATSLPFPVLILLTGAITGVLGILIGLPALRLSGLYLALITLMAAGAITVVLQAWQFPDGGPGFLGRTGAVSGTSQMRRPDVAIGDTSYFRYTVIVCALMFGLALWHIAAKPGRAWAAIRQSEPAALAGGVNITVYKLWAFALAAFMTGVAGCLLAASGGGLSVFTFPTSASIQLFAVVLMGGIYSMWGAVVAGVLLRLLPALFEDWGIRPDLLVILFGVGVFQVLLTAPAGIAAQFPQDMKKLGRGLGKLAGRVTGAGRPGEEA